MINTLIVRHNDVEVFSAEMGSGFTANPLLQFYTGAETSSEFDFDRVDDAGNRGRESAMLVVDSAWP